MIEILNRYTKAVLFTSATAADLRGSNLSGSNLSGADLSFADLRGSNLSGSNLSWSDLSGSNLSGADLSGSDLSDSNLRGSDLSGSDLSGSDLSGSDLSGSDLSGSDLSGETVMPQGETWKRYLAEVVPALLTGGGASLADVANREHWECHDWDNCPMAAAYGISSDSEGPLLLQPRIREFIQYFDAKLIPMPEVKA